MSYGFSFVSGSGNTVTVNSDNDAVGVFVDYFFVAYNTTVTNTYTSFEGTSLYALVIQQTANRLNVPITSINDTTKTVSVTSTLQTASARQAGLYVLVLGK